MKLEVWIGQPQIAVLLGRSEPQVAGLATCGKDDEFSLLKGIGVALIRSIVNPITLDDWDYAWFRDTAQIEVDLPSYLDIGVKARELVKIGGMSISKAAENMWHGIEFSVLHEASGLPGKLHKYHLDRVEQNKKHAELYTGMLAASIGSLTEIASEISLAFAGGVQTRTLKGVAEKYQGLSDRSKYFIREAWNAKETTAAVIEPPSGEGEKETA